MFLSSFLFLPLFSPNIIIFNFSVLSCSFFFPRYFSNFFSILLISSLFIATNAMSSAYEIDQIFFLPTTSPPSLISFNSSSKSLIYMLNMSALNLHSCLTPFSFHISPIPLFPILILLLVSSYSFITL